VGSNLQDFLLRTQVFWVMTSSGTITDSRRFERTIAWKNAKNETPPPLIGVPIFPALTDSTYIFSHLVKNETNRALLYRETLSGLLQQRVQIKDYTSGSRWLCPGFKS